MMGRSRREQSFEYRIQQLFQDAGWVTLNCATSRPFDLVICRSGQVFLLELKAINGEYSSEQREMQRALATQAGLPLLLIEQLVKPPGRMRVTKIMGGYGEAPNPASWAEVEHILWPYLELPVAVDYPMKNPVPVKGL